MQKTWVVYKWSVPGGPCEAKAVCEQREWEAMQRKQPGYHQLVRCGITSESEAEVLARGTAGDTARGQPRWQSVSPPRRVTTASEHAAEVAKFLVERGMDTLGKSIA